MLKQSLALKIILAMVCKELPLEKLQHTTGAPLKEDNFSTKDYSESTISYLHLTFVSGRAKNVNSAAAKHCPATIYRNPCSCSEDPVMIGVNWLITKLDAPSANVVMATASPIQTKILVPLNVCYK